MRSYRVNEIFYSLQGEGIRAGEASVFVRLAGCNLRCDLEPGDRSPGGFACDTEFVSFTEMSAQEIADRAAEIASDECSWIVLTGGEPTLQVDDELITTLHEHNWELAIETNGTSEVDPRIDHITVSPKVAEHAIKQRTATEVKYVRAVTQALPVTVIKAEHYFISPASEGQIIPPENLAWCIALVKENPRWKLTTQLHKLWSVR